MHRRIKNAKERSRKSGITNSRPEWWRLSRSIELRVGCRCLQTLHNYVNQTKYIWFVWEITQRERETGRNGRKGASFLCDLVLISTYIFVSRSVRLRFVSVVCTALHGFLRFLLLLLPFHCVRSFALDDFDAICVIAYCIRFHYCTEWFGAMRECT